MPLLSYRAGLRVIWMLLSQLHFYEQLACVENDGVLDQEMAGKMVANYIAKLKNYREHPENHLGGSIEDAESEI